VFLGAVVGGACEHAEVCELFAVLAAQFLALGPVLGAERVEFGAVLLAQFSEFGP